MGLKGFWGLWVLGVFIVFGGLKGSSMVEGVSTVESIDRYIPIVHN